jgi:Ca2+-dependent lipid-binding protein
MDWALSFTPNDMQDVTPRMAETRVNPKIVLTIRLGKGFVSTGMPILLEDINFSGRMRIKLKLMPTMPHVQKVEMSFLEKPHFDFVLKPLGGETLGFDINNIPGLEPFIHSQVHNALGPMMYDPNVFTLDLEQMLSGAPLDAAIGVVKVTILDAHGLKSVKIGGGLPDPYVSLSLGAKPSVARTKTIMASANPAFGETHFILVSSLADVLNFNVFDFNELRTDDHIGTASAELAPFAEDAEVEGAVAKILGGGKDRGELRYDMFYYPTIQAEKKPDGTLEPLPDIPTGIVRLQIHQAKDLDSNPKDTNAVAKVFLGSSKTPCHTSDPVKKSNSPSWESHVEFIVADKHASVVTVLVQDKSSSLGRVTVKLDDILAAKEAGNDWFPLQGTRGAKLRLSANFKPVSMPGALDGAASYTPPIGILRVWIKNAQDVRNVESALGKSDPYVRVQVNNRTLARTEVQNNNLNPVWDQIVYVPVHSLRGRVVLELMDYENIGKDRTLGTVALDVSECADANESNNEYPYASKGVQQRSDRIRLEKGNYKGVLNYEVDFKPAMSLRGGVSFDAPKNDVAAAAQKVAAQTNGNGAASSSTSLKSSAKSAASTPAPPVAPATTEAASSSTSLKSSAKSAASTPAPSVAPATTEAAPAPTATVDSAAVTSAAVAKETPGDKQLPPPVPTKDGSAPNGKTDEEPTAIEKEETGVVMTDAQLLMTQSGVIVFQVIEGQLARKGALEVLFDDGYWPAYVSEPARSTHARWDQVGEGFVRELEFGRTILRINASNDGDEDIVAECKMDTHEFLEASLNKEVVFTLTSPDGASRSTVKMSSRFVPINIKLEQRETINNQGVLRVTAVGAKHLKAADRGGKSDPNITFLLNGMKVFKSETKKKTVHPVWNETFEVSIPSRIGGKFKYEVNDWNAVGASDPLGEGYIDMAALDPFQLQSLDLPVMLEGKQYGTVQINVLFQPGIIARSRQKTNTFTATTLGAPVAVGKGVVAGGSAVVSGVGSVITAPTRLFRKKDRSASHSAGSAPPMADPIAAGHPVPAVPVPIRDVQLQPGAAVSGPVEVVEELAPAGYMASTNFAATAPEVIPQEPGTLTVAVMGVKSLQPNSESHGSKDLKPFISLKMGDRSVVKTDSGKGIDYDWNENFSFNVGDALASKILSVRAYGE